MRLKGTLKLWIAIAILAAEATSAHSQDWPEFLEPRQLFRVVVSGTGSSGTKLPNVKGTAWAIAPGIVVTANHVTGSASNYMNASATDKLFIPQRNVTLEVSPTKTFTGSPSLKFAGGIVTPSPFESIDAARIGIQDLAAKPFQLTACEIVHGTEYRVLKFNDGNVFQPIPVAAELKAYGRSSLGDAGSVVVMKGPKGNVVEGDSGSPLLDADGRVIGLVSAVNPDSGSAVHDEVHITLVRSFLDLIPLQAGDTEFLDIPCSERAKLKSIDTLTAEVLSLNGELSAAQKAIAVATGRITTLEEQRDVHLQQINTLLRHQLLMVRHFERASGDFETSGLPDPGLSDEDANQLLWSANKEEFEADPASKVLPPLLRPTVRKISSELGNPDWSLLGSIDSKKTISIALKYERTLSGKPYADELRFCFTPIVWDVAEETPAAQDPSHRKFYEPLEQPFEKESDRYANCMPAAHTTADLRDDENFDRITQGNFIWGTPIGGLQLMRQVAELRYPGSSWDGLAYLQIFEPQEHTDGQIRFHLLERAFLDLLRDGSEGTAMPCRRYEQIEPLLNDIGDGRIDLADEVQNTRGTECT